MASAKENYEFRTDQAELWIQRWKKATDYFRKWEERHKCRQLAEYYEGQQYDPANYPEGMDPLVFNLFYSAVESRLPIMSFQNPVAQIKPKPSVMDYEPDLAAKEAALRTDMVNTFVGDPDNHFGEICEQAIIDAQFYFGLVEVDYSASWVENPHARKPVLKTDSSESADPDSPEDNVDPKEQPEELPEEERIYVKHIAPRDFRVGGNDKWVTEQCSWVGYREFFRREDLLSIGDFKKILELGNAGTGYRSDDFVPAGRAEDGDADSTDLVECYTIFDLRKKTRIFLSRTDSVVLREQSFERLPIKALRFSKPAVEHSWLPIPPAKSWKSPQDEYNESHRMQAAYRQRALPKFIANDSAFADEAELDKLSSPVPFTISKISATDVNSAIAPLPMPSLNAEFGKSLITSRDEFNFAAGTSLDISPAADRETATKSKIVAARAGVRESRTLGIVGLWMADIIREIAKLQAERLTKEVWVKRLVDTEPTLGEVQEITHIWTRIDPTSALTKDFDFTAEVDVSSLSPVTQEANKNNLLEFCAIVNQYPQFAFSPKLIRYLANVLNLRMEMVIKEMQNLAMVAQMGIAAQAQAAMGGGEQNAMAQRTVAQATPNTNEQINNQLKNQVGLPQQ